MIFFVYSSFFCFWGAALRVMLDKSVLSEVTWGSGGEAWW